VPRNWIGTIHFRGKEEEYIINLLPKIFHKENGSPTEKEINGIFTHILWWLSGSEKQNYSTVENSLDALESDLLEVMVFMFSEYTLDVFSGNSYNYYETVEEDLQTVKGYTDFNKYVDNYARGNRHIIPCVYDSFQYNNKFNQIVKYVANLLKDFTKSKTSKRNLEELLFLLDKVEYKIVTVEDCDQVILNPIYTEFKTILDNCRLFLSSLSVYKWKDDYNVFALLIPSEKLFENFIFSILKNNQGDQIKKVSRSRPGRSYLAKQLPNTNRFKMLSDIVLKLVSDDYIIFDTKYKKIYNSNIDDEELDPVYNISQSDIYQMVSYAIGSGVTNIGLIYPSLLNEDKNKELPIYEISDELSEGQIIRIFPFKIDIIHKDGLSFLEKGKLEDIFEETKEKLIVQLHSAVEKINNFKNENTK
jgi:5-methylcytosine-specific restriction enzyme subunit McrC